jgi:pyruvate dehydrogenase E2 component (dihydrolipoyllysine-residue acetyltransferase)
VPFEFKLPDLGEGIHEAQVLAWRVSPGQDVAAFQPLCEVESAKAAVELTAPVAGRVVETRFAVGDTAQKGDVLVLIETEQAANGEWFGIVGSAPKPAPAPPPPQLKPIERKVLAAPFVRKLARERGIRLEEVQGSGPQGRVRIGDLDQLSARPEKAIPLKGMRKAIADHMVEAWRNAPQVTSMDLLDVTELVRARELLQPTAQDEGAKLTYLPFFVKASIEALRAVPEANAVVRDQAIELKDAFHIGIATAIPGGLVVPVVRNADRLSLVELAREIDHRVTAARERHLLPADLTGSTFTITSFGGLPGSPMFATPILNYPEVAILGLGRIDLQPRVVDGQVVARHCIGVSFTFDHRVLDGEGAGRFMAALKRYVEQPLELLLRLR